MNLSKMETVKRVYGGDWELFLADRRLKGRFNYERQKMMCEEHPEVYESFKEKIKFRNEKRKLKENYKEKNREYNRKYYQNNIKKSVPTLKQLADVALDTKEKRKNYYKNRTPEQKALYKANAKAKRDAMTPEEKEAKKQKKKDWYQKQKMERLNDQKVTNA